MGAISNFRNRKIAQQNGNKKHLAEAPKSGNEALVLLAKLLGCEEQNAIDNAHKFMGRGARIIGFDPALKGADKTVMAKQGPGLIEVRAEFDGEELHYAANLVSDSASELSNQADSISNTADTLNAAANDATDSASDISDASHEVSSSAASIADATADISAAADEIKEVVSEVKKSPEALSSSPSKSETKPEKSSNK